MSVLVIVLAVTNVVTLTALIVLYRLLEGRVAEPPDGVVAAALEATPPSSATSTTRARRIISVEVLNPIELAGSRGGWRDSPGRSRRGSPAASSTTRS